MVEDVTLSATLVFKSRHFDRFARREGLDDAELLVAAIEVRAGRFDANLGGGVFKKRIARAGGGKSGGFRTIILCASDTFTVFAYGYAKSEQADLSPDQVRAFKRAARELSGYSLSRAREAFVELEVSRGN